jgi:putative ABC transport system permease protein
MRDFFHDVKHSLRAFWNSPGFTFAAVAALALGIGANTAIFSIVDAVLLKPVPFPEPDRLVVFQQTGPRGAFSAGSPAKFQFWRDQTSVVQDVSAYRSNVLNFTGGGVPEQLHADQVSADYFKLFGAPVERGRGFNADEDLPGGNHVTLLSHALWMRRFGGDPNILGKSSRSAAIPTRSSASSDRASTSPSSALPPSCGFRSSSTRTAPIRATTSRSPGG